MENKKIVCLGGGIGTVNVLKGIKVLTKNITVVVSMADDGGSAGRLRRLYNIFPPGDIVSCMAAYGDNDLLAKLLTYRFPGDRYGRDADLAGHKLGNLIMVAMRDLTGDFLTAVKLFQKTFSIEGTFLPATNEPVTLSAVTKDGKQIHGEENIDLGKYDGERVLNQVFLHPGNPHVVNEVIQAIEAADVIIAGPGDLYTTTLPVLIVPAIKEALIKAKGKKIFIVNVTNKPFETKGYTVADYIRSIAKHVGVFPFTKVLVNNDYQIPIPKKYKYTYVKMVNKDEIPEHVEIITDDLVNYEFPLYHSETKLAKVIIQHV